MNNNKNNNPYGHLLDKYLDGAHFDYRTEEQKKEEERARYGNLLDNTKTDNSIWENMLGVYESGICHENEPAQKGRRGDVLCQAQRTYRT